MQKYDVRPANFCDIFKIASRMRREDREEIWAAEGKKPLEALEEGFEASAQKFVGLKDGEMLCMFGVQPVVLASRTACVWMLTTEAAKDYPKALLYGTRDALEVWRQQYTILFNFVDARYTSALRWAAWAGFDIYPAEPYGYLGLPFHRIVMGSW